MIRYLIVDDEPLAHDLIESYCNRLPYLKLADHCYDALEALEYLNSNTIDLMFLDLNMPKLKGFEFLRTLKDPPKIIVTTAYEEHALEGFELAVEDYLVKPFSFERFLKGLNKALNPKNEKKFDTLSNETLSTKFFVKGDKKYHQIDAHKILYVEAFGNYVKLFLEDEMIIVHEKISEFENFLPEQEFLRVHRSFMVALDKIETLQGNLILIKEYEIPIGQTYSSAVQNKLLNKL